MYCNPGPAEPGNDVNEKKPITSPLGAAWSPAISSVPVTSPSALFTGDTISYARLSGSPTGAAPAAVLNVRASPLIVPKVFVPTTRKW